MRIRAMVTYYTNIWSQHGFASGSLDNFDIIGFTLTIVSSSHFTYGHCEKFKKGISIFHMHLHSRN